MSKTDAAEADVLRLFTGQAMTLFTSLPITPYIALYTAMTSTAEAQTATEATGNGYLRQSATFGAPTGTAPTTVTNSGIVLFPVATPAGYTLVGAGLVNASSAGTLLRFQVFGSSLVLAQNDQAQFAVGAIQFTED